MQNVHFYKLLAAIVVALPLLVNAQAKKKVQPGKKVTTTKKKTVAAVKTVPVVNYPFQLTVEAKGVKDSTLAVIYHPFNRQYQGPNGYVKNGRVVLQGTLPQADGYGLVLTDNKTHTGDKFYTLFLGNEHSQIEVDGQSNNFRIISGVSQQAAFDDLRMQFGQYFNEYGRVSQLIQQVGASGQPVDSLKTLLSGVSAGINSQVPQFISKYPSSPVSAFLLATIRDVIPGTQLLENIALLKDTAAIDERIVALKGELESDLLLAEGQPAPDFTQNDTLGKPVSLNSFKGKYVLVDFWASWCRPCRMENPNVLNVYNQYKDKNFTVLGVSLDRDRSNWIQAIHDDGLAWTHVSDLQFWSNAVAQKYGIQSIPQNLLIGPDGKIVAKNLRGADLQEYMRNLIK